ncbi:LuxE/PaaK family acyltransferase [Anaerostipes sp.]|uniref:LuxE/PaaK family acyltransferase n=1 Tax=Anaerostipes sp. TaxID=1872530 RepID=UPI0025BEB43D|nr:acyl-protein synthetase [Anaerostipes sp.]MBS7009886.1 acyl-protein synthetase [Anaerostipes sp.]
MDYDELLRKPPFGMRQKEKEEWYVSYMEQLTRHHMEHCLPYNRFIKSSGGKTAYSHLEQIPMLPVSLFKSRKLSSVPDEQVFKIMTSSGTTGQQVSHIYLDRETASYQQKTLSVIMGDFLGAKRIPMLILDSPGVLKDRKMFSARGAGILGFSILASERMFAFNEDMELDMKGIEEFLERHKEEKIFLFGFTFMIWKFFVRKLKQSGEKLEIPRGFLIHGGGWKKLWKEAVSREQFREEIFEVSKIEHVRNYYGMVEQTGCIYMECEYGHLHASIFSEPVIRRGKDFSVCETGEEGLVQVLSPMARSYPGHSLLTEDLGLILGRDDCPCGRKGTYFQIRGRIRKAEIRGCSDTYEK